MELFNTITSFEVIGYLASILVAASFLMKNIVWLRLVNSAGCLLFVFYGIEIEAWPVAGMNGFICLVNTFYLVKMYRKNLRAPEIKNTSTKKAIP